MDFMKSCRLVGKFFFLIFSGLGILLNAAIAQSSLQEQEKALSIIADFAGKICADIPLMGSGSNMELSGSAKLELGGILKKISDLGIEGAAKYQDNEYQGLLQKDLVQALKTSTNCRLQVWNDLKSKILSSTPVRQLAPVQKQTEAQFVIMDKWRALRLYQGTFYSENACRERITQLSDSSNYRSCRKAKEVVYCFNDITEGEMRIVRPNCYENMEWCIKGKKSTDSIHSFSRESWPVRRTENCSELPLEDATALIY